MGLKQMIEKAMSGDDEVAAMLEEKRPVKISGDAHKAYARLVRKWTGWPNATLKFEEPEVSPFASCNHKARIIRANPERLLLNPNRVLLKVNPFRLRQEAVLTGALLHEAAHARHTQWVPRNAIDAEAFKHSDGSDVTKAEFALAKVFEEARIEGIIASEADKIGAEDLVWTMRAMAAYVVPMTELAVDPAQALVDLLSSWGLRVGRQHALAYHTNHNPAAWVPAFTQLVHVTLVEHFVAMGEPSGQATVNALTVVKHLGAMATGTDAVQSATFPIDASFVSDSGPFMVDKAKGVLSMLFPETPPDQMPMAGGGCGAGEPEDQGEGVSDLPEDGDEEGEAGAGEPDDTEGEGQEGEGGDSPSDQGEGEGEGEGTGEVDTKSELAKALAAAEGQASEQTKTESHEKAQSTDNEGGMSGGVGPGAPIGGGWRNPTIPEREIKANAEKFLREMIEPNVASKVRITDQPSSMIDGAALAAWKAGGQIKAPRFFQQVKRTVKPTPPVKIAVLVDISSSMDQMQKPSALLSWALAAACLDLRNYAGGGVQIESTLIHWGSTARVIQRNGHPLPGIRVVPCNDGTTAMHHAYELIDEQIPGFFEVKDQPENKLIVQFTDWELNGTSVPRAQEWVGRGLESGASLLSVVPRGFTHRHTKLAPILAETKVQRGRSHLLKYDPSKPNQVWDTAARALGYGR